MVTKLAKLVDLREKIIIPIAFWVSRARSDFLSLYQCCPINILWTNLLKITKLGLMVATREWIIIEFQVHILQF